MIVDFFYLLRKNSVAYFIYFNSLSLPISKLPNACLFSPYESKPPKGKTFAFTLAEVLIVLGIIGIIANMTIPTLVENVQQQILLIQFQGIYSSLQQAYIQVAQENGTGDKWNDTTLIYNNFKPYFKFIKECPDGTCVVTHSTYRDLNGVADTSINPTYHLMLQNGGTLCFSAGEDDSPATVKLDTNGYKLPNRLGYDLFELEFNKKNNAPFVSWPFYGSASASFVEGSSQTCNKSSSTTSFWMGGGCSYWLIKNGNMDYLNRNIPNSEWIK